MPAQLRSACFTIHFKTPKEQPDELAKEFHKKVDELLVLFDIEFSADYWCIGLELGSSGETPHGQGYVHFHKRQSFKKFGKAMGCNIRSANGTAAQNKTYCSKEGIKFLEFGKIPTEIKKFDEAAALEAAREDRVEDIARLAPRLYLRHRPSLERVQLENSRPSCRIRKCFWLVGKPRTFKSRFAYQFSLNAYIKSTGKWWDGCTKKCDTVIINDVDPSNAQGLAYNLKIWADPYPLRVEVKTSHVSVDYTYLFVTSNYRIDTLYTDPELRQALHERFKEIPVLEGRETPIGEIEIKTYLSDENKFLGFKWLNQHSVLD